MWINRGLLNWGVFLIALGGVPLAVQQGLAESSIAGDLWRVWPLILVGIGLGLILRWTPIAWLGGALVAATFGLMFGALIAGGVSGISSACIGIGSGTGVTTTQSGAATSSQYRLEVELSCGDLAVARGGAPQWSVTAEHAPDAPPSITASDGGLVVGSGSQVEDFFVFSQQTRNDISVELPSLAALSVDAQVNAASGQIDLGSGPVGSVEVTLNASDGNIDLGASSADTAIRLEVEMNASSGRLALPSAAVDGSVTLNASSLTLCIPSTVEVRVELDSTLSADDLEESGLAKVAGAWQSAGYDGSASRADLSLTSTVSSLTVERPEVCS